MKTCLDLVEQTHSMGSQPHIIWELYIVGCAIVFSDFRCFYCERFFAILEFTASSFCLRRFLIFRTYGQRLELIAEVLVWSQDLETCRLGEPFTCTVSLQTL